MSIYTENFGYGDQEAELSARLKTAQDRTLYPSDPVEFIKWVQETVRDHTAAFDKLRVENEKLNHSADLATIGLKRLESLIVLNQRPKSDYLIDLHRNFVFKNQAIGRVLDDCQGRIREIITNYQMVAESLGNPLADRHKKIAIQKELGLRLKDLDEANKRCHDSVEGQHKLNKQLSEGIQLLLSETAVKLAPAEKEILTKEDEVRRIAMNLKKTLQEGKDAVNYVPYNPKSEKKQKFAIPFPEIVKRDQKKKENIQGLDQTSSGSFSFTGAAAALVIGTIIGIMLFFRPVR